MVGSRLAFSRLVLLMALVLLALACAYASPIQPAATSRSPFWFPGWGRPETVVSKVPEGEQLRISHRASSGFTPVSALRRSAEARATQFCADKGRVVTLVTEQQSSAPHILGNFPRFEIVFVCTEKPSVAGPAAAGEDPYERLKRLKGLLDAGVISQHEFDQEKRELLER